LFFGFLLFYLGLFGLTFNVSVVFFTVAIGIIYFANWYLSVTSSLVVFYSQFLVFQLAIVLLVDMNNFYFLILGWEIMGVLSYFLIMTFNSRFLAQNGSILAFLVNRVGDFFLFFWLVSELSFLVRLAILTKSSLTVFSNWLPNAMEGPTPVSSLLHSSTMVVARVFILSFLGVFSVPLFLMVIFFGVFCRFFRRFIKDFKRTVAFSTSSQLRLVRLFWLMGGYYLTVFYVLTHALFKAMIFIVVGFLIHKTDSQLFVRNSSLIFWGNSVFGCLVISGLPFFSVSSCKDSIVIRYPLVLTILVIWSTLLYCIMLLSLSSNWLLLFGAGRLGLVTTLLTVLSFVAVSPLELSVDFLHFLSLLLYCILSYTGNSGLKLTRISEDSKIRVSSSHGLRTAAFSFYLLRLRVLLLA